MLIKVHSKTNKQIQSQLTQQSGMLSLLKLQSLFLAGEEEIADPDICTDESKHTADKTELLFEYPPLELLEKLSAELSIVG
mmetsp:Transcript_86740/g.173529  ORF Transcript_86740/g.173529 Transcript_86740/m.173529 type:complete len:81 (+) Transcript_86740:326-568(+)